MASILPDYEYDIFISYRQKDNKYDGWVTEFVQNLEREIEATFKEDISIYFDANPHDGLLETHHVDKSLEGKLKCLVLIPILSQTYCDPKSFAWQHEFCAFNKIAKEDKLGRDIRLTSGNVSSRILPVKIHDLDTEDKSLIETETGSVLRAIEFIYKEPGVNRSLRPSDNKNENQNKTDYRNQINKIANAIKEIIYAIKYPHLKHAEGIRETAPLTPSISEQGYAQNTSWTTKLKEIRKTIIFFLAIGISVYFIFFDRDKKHNAKTFDSSIAVLPFEDLSPAHDQEYFSDGIAEEILNSLAHIKELKVAGRTSSFQFKGQKADLKEVGKILGVGTVLEGSVRKAGDRVRITAQLINAKDGYHIWSETYDRDMTDIFAIQDEVAQRIAGMLLKELSADKIITKGKGTEDPKAYEYYLEGKYINLHQFAFGGKLEDFKRAEDLFKKALSLDSNYALAHAGLADLYNTYTFRIKKDSLYMRLQTQEIEKAYSLDPDDDYVNNALGQVQSIKGEFLKAHESLIKAMKINPNDANNCFSLGSSFVRLGLLDEAKQLFDKAIHIDPLEANNYFLRGTVHFQLSQYDKAYADFQEMLKLQPQNSSAITFIALYFIIKNEMGEAKEYIERYKKLAPSPFVFSAEAVYEAKLGHKEKALQLSKDFRVYLVLGMSEEAVQGILTMFGHIPPPINFYLGLSRSPLIDKVGQDPRIVEFIARQKKGYEENKTKFRLPKEVL